MMVIVCVIHVIRRPPTMTSAIRTARTMTHVCAVTLIRAIVAGVIHVSVAGAIHVSVGGMIHAFAGEIAS